MTMFSCKADNLGVTVQTLAMEEDRVNQPEMTIFGLLKDVPLFTFNGIAN